MGGGCDGDKHRERDGSGSKTATKTHDLTNADADWRKRYSREPFEIPAPGFSVAWRPDAGRVPGTPRGAGRRCRCCDDPLRAGARPEGLPLLVMVTPADVSDRGAVREVLSRLGLTHPELTVDRADSAYVGGLVEWSRSFLRLTVKTVSRSKNTPGYGSLTHAGSEWPCPSGSRSNGRTRPAAAPGAGALSGRSRPEPRRPARTGPHVAHDPALTPPRRRHLTSRREQTAPARASGKPPKSGWTSLYRSRSPCSSARLRLAGRGGPGGHCVLVRDDTWETTP